MEFFSEHWSEMLSALVSLGAIIVAFYKAKKGGNVKGIVKLISQIPALVTSAESLFGAKKGEAKLNHVLTQLRLYALQNGIKVNVDELTAYINSVVETTKNVNVEVIEMPTPSTDRSDNIDSQDNDIHC